jgi:transposase
MALYRPSCGGVAKRGYIYSILASCCRRRIDPEDYLSDVLRRLPDHKINQIDELLPANWKPLSQ